MGTNLVGYNASDPLIQDLLSGLNSGEGSPGVNTGVGYTSLQGDSTDNFGFPEWSGDAALNSHAAGLFQFQPGTWDQIASQFGLNFQNPADQEAGAWYYAQQTYTANTGGQSLYTALQQGDYSSIQSALQGVWPGGAKGLSSYLGSNASGASLPGLGGTTSGAPAPASTSGGLLGGLMSGVSDAFVRGGLIIAGSVVLAIALWQLLADQGIVPGPVETAKAAGKTVVAAVAA